MRWMDIWMDWLKLLIKYKIVCNNVLTFSFSKIDTMVTSSDLSLNISSLSGEVDKIKKLTVFYYQLVCIYADFGT